LSYGQSGKFFGQVSTAVNVSFFPKELGKEIVLRLHAANAEFLIQIVHCGWEVLKMVDLERHLNAVANPAAHKLHANVNRSVELAIGDSVSEMNAVSWS